MLQTTLNSALQLTQRGFLLAYFRRETVCVLQIAQIQACLPRDLPPSSKWECGTFYQCSEHWQRPIGLFRISLPHCTTSQLHKKKQCRRKGHAEQRETSLLPFSLGGPFESFSNFYVSPYKAGHITERIILGAGKWQAHAGHQNSLSP